MMGIESFYVARREIDVTIGFSYKIYRGSISNLWLLWKFIKLNVFVALDFL